MTPVTPKPAIFGNGNFERNLRWIVVYSPVADYAVKFVGSRRRDILHSTIFYTFYFYANSGGLFRSTPRMTGRGPCKPQFKQLCIQNAILIAFSWKWFNLLKTNQPLNHWDSSTGKAFHHYSPLTSMLGHKQSWYDGQVNLKLPSPVF